MNSKLEELVALSLSDLHQYTFSIDGTVTYRRCYVTKIQHQKVRRRGTYIFYRSYDENNPYSVHTDDIDNDVATMSCQKVVVLTEPDFEKAKKIVEKGMRESIKKHQKIIDSLYSQIERLDILEVGKKAEGSVEFPMNTVRKHIINSRKGVDSKYFIVPPVVCKDGFTMSVQHSSLHYCEPRIDFAERKGHEFISYEVGYPSEAEDILIFFAEDPKNPTSTVYANVPAQIVEQVAEMHGGLAS